MRVDGSLPRVAAIAIGVKMEIARSSAVPPVDNAETQVDRWCGRPECRR
jgi:hypothetical protein